MNNNKALLQHKKYWLGLKQIPAIRNRLYMLADRAGGPQKLWAANVERLEAIGLSPELAQETVACRKQLDLDLLYGQLETEGVSLLTDADSGFPELLRAAPGYPRVLFVKGALPAYGAAVAIVGARNASALGLSIAAELASDLVKAGVLIVSGGARGIDSAAHRGALDAGGATCAVLGCGLDVVYPPNNRKLFGEIIENGALISEYPAGTPPLTYHFPARNRIVAGMCQAVVVVEAGEKSGALITVDFALEYGRDVFAVPGHSRNTLSKGTNKLIKQGAFLVETAEDILEVLGIDYELTGKTETLTTEEKGFLEVLGWEAKRFDEIVRETSRDIAGVSTLLLSLELEGYIKKDMSGCYIRVR